MNLIVIGSVAYDSIQTPFGSAERTLGGSASYCSLAAAYFCNTGVVGVVGDDFAEADRRTLSENGVNIEGLATAPGKTFFWSGEYDFNLNNRTTLVTELNVFEHFRPQLPESYAGAPYLFLGNIHPELQLQAIAQCPAARFVGLDTMNYWIEKTPQALERVLQQVDTLIVNDSEARELSGQHNIHKAAKAILGMLGDSRGPSPKPTLVIKRGEYGALMFQAGTIFSLPAYPLEDVYDPTGAGDSFAGGFMGHLAATGDLSWENAKRACVAGSVMASFCVEKMGVAGLLQITEEQKRQRGEMLVKTMSASG